MNLKLTAPITTWDEAIPLGNGLQGALLWGEGGTLRFSLDRGDLWDERPANGNPLAGFTYAKLVQLVAAKDNESIGKIAGAAGGDVHPTKIPAGRLEIDLAAGQKASQFALNLTTATASVKVGAGAKVDAFFSATEPVSLLRLSGAEPRACRLLAPESVKKLGYSDPEKGSDDSAQWFVQAAAEGASYCVMASTRRVGEVTLIATTVTYSPVDGDDLVEVAKQRATAALDSGYEALLAEHVAWWQKFWAISSVQVPDEQVMLHYHLVQYFYGSASRRGAPPLPLQGVWTADEGELPPWKGDYHHDLNTQMTYMGYQTAGRMNEGLSFLDFMNDLRPMFRKFAAEFYETSGAVVPTIMSLAGNFLAGWAQYSMSPVHGAWVGHLYYLHWRHTRDETFLREVAYPWCAEIGEALRTLLKPNDTGVLVLATSASPEAWNADMRAWVTPNSTYDISCLRMLFLGNAEMAARVGESTAAKEWTALAEGLGPWHVDEKNRLKISPDEDLEFSHRHFATIMSIYPFNLLNIEGTEAEREIVYASVHDLDRLGVLEWVGFSYTWMSALRARIGEPESALWYLKAFLHACVSRNGFHLNGDQTKTGFTSLEYRPFTLEGNFMVCSTVHEMLLQSWAAHPGTGEWGPLRIFPAMPWRWHEASFTDLLAEGGHKVSAKRENNATTWLRVTAGASGELRIRDNFEGHAPDWNRDDVQRDGDDFLFKIAKGEVIEATLPKPAQIPAEPPPPPAPADGWLDQVPIAPKDPGVPMYP